MSLLLVKSQNGQIRQFELSKNQPLTIGSHTISDIQIDSEGVALMEARLSWAKKQFEITAAGANKLLVNGEPVQSASLQPGDRITIGTVEFLFTTPEELENAGVDPFFDQQESEEIGLQPISEEIPAWEQKAQAPLPRKTKDSDSQSSRKKQRSGTRQTEFQHRKENQEFFEKALEGASEKINEPDSSADNEPVSKVQLSRSGSASQSPPAQKTSTSTGALRESLYASRQRPGEKEIFRSPLIMGLGLLGIFLLIGSVVLWSLIDLEEADRYLSRAREQAEQRKFQQAIDDYEQFLLLFPYDSDNETASRELSLTRVRSQLDIGVPDLSAGIQELEQLIKQHREETNFNEMHEEISKFATQIALEACEKAAEERNTDLFQLSERALKLVNLYTLKEDRLEQILSEIKQARQDAEATIQRLNVFDQAIAEMNSGLDKKKPSEVMAVRRDLISQQESAETDARVTKLLEDALRLEKESAIIQDEAQKALNRPSAISDALLTLSAGNLIVKDEIASNRAILVHAADCLYGVDTNIGVPIWRHPVGRNLPFFPVEVTLGQPGVLSSAVETRELHYLDRDTGEPIWRQTCDDQISGRPLIVRNHAYVTTHQGRLLKLDLTNGEIVSEIAFSQPLATGASLLPGKTHLVCVGQQDVLYLVSLNPWEVSEVYYLGHRPGTIQTAPLEMNPYLLIAENHETNACRLRLFDTRLEKETLKEIHQESLPGLALDPLELRGNLLFVPTTPERVTAFTISAEKNTPSMSKTNSHQAVNPRMTPAWLSAGPDGLLWTASSALRQLQLLSESLEPSTNEVAIGLATQPLQMLGESLFAARHPLYSSSIFVSRYNRNNFEAFWSLKLGDSVLFSHLNNNGELITLHGSGEVFRLRPNEFGSSAFKLKQNSTVPIPASLSANCLSSQFSDGRFGVAWGGEEPQIVTVRTTGLLEQETVLPDPPLTPPIDLKAGVAIGLAGRIHMVTRNGTEVEDYLLPVEDGQQATWKALLRLDDSHLLTLDSSHTLRRLEYVTEPIPHFNLNEQVALEFVPMTSPMLTSAGQLLVIDVENHLYLLNPETLQTQKTRTLPDSPNHDPWIANNATFLELKNNILLCLNQDESATQRWQLDLEGTSLSGTPLLIEDVWFLPTSDSGIWKVSNQDGTRIEQINVSGHCDGSPILLPNQIAFPLADGTIFFLPKDKSVEEAGS